MKIDLHHVGGSEAKPRVAEHVQYPVPRREGLHGVRQPRVARTHLMDGRRRAVEGQGRV